MRKPVFKILFTAVFAILASCGAPQKEESRVDTKNKEMPAEERAERKLYDDVMHVHNEAMPKMDNMMRLKGQLQEKLDLLREQDEIEGTEELEEAINNLEEADEAMMQWMRDFEPQDDESLSHEEVLRYYEKKRNAIAEVHEQMKASIAKAEELTKE